MMDNSKISWPGWETVKLIGRGSFGAVYEIQRDVLGDVEKAALKVISIPQNASDIDEMYSDGYDDESITSTFQSHLKSIVAEYSLMRKMNGSANIVNCDDIRYVQHDDGIGWDIFIKMELLTPLAKALPAQIPEEMAVKIAKDMCAALELCQKHNIVHRDIKPQNIFLSPNGDYKLGDFGIAKTVEKTMGGTKIGTYKYMAPEVYNNQPYGTEADIYSLGLVLYWMLNERRMPFLPLPPEKLTTTMEETARMRRFKGEQLPPPVHGKAGLKKIVMKACAYDPKDRYATAADMLTALKKLSDGTVATTGATPILDPEPAPKPAPDPEPAPKPTPDTGLGPEQPDPISKPHKNRVVIVACLLAVVAAVIGFFSIHSWTEATCTEPAVCRICGKTAGEATGHIWTEATCTEPSVCRICGKVAGEATGHLWTEATCTESAICRICGKVAGEATGHLWTEATCTEPAVCRICGEITGEATGHIWIDATCTEPRTCAVCAAVDGVAAGHTWPTIEKLANCTVCDTPNGSIVHVDAYLLASSWTDQAVELALDGGKKVGANILTLPSKIEECYSVTLCLQIGEFTAGNIHGQWGFYIRDLSGQWHLADTFFLKGDYVEAYFEFDEPISFDAWACPCHVLGDYWDFSFSVWLADATVFEYTG